MITLVAKQQSWTIASYCSELIFQ